MKSPDTFTDFQKNVMQEQNSSSEMASSETDMTHENIVTFNIGGVIFQTLESTLKHPKRPAYRLLDSEMLERHWDEERCVYFFDRDPAVFQTVLNYLRTGVLHLPQNMCSPQITTELLYWGLPRIDIQPCCWKDYSFGIQTLENLRKLEKDRRPAYANPDYFNESKAPATGCNRIVSIVWNVVTDPSYSTISKIYGWTSIAIILASILTFCIGTLPQFLHSDPPNETLHSFELMFVAYFTMDLLLHLITMPCAKYYLYTFEGVVDISSLVPDLLGIVVEAILDSGKEGGSMAFVRSLRALRVFRLFKRVKHLWIIIYTLKASLKDFAIVFMVFTVAVILFSGIVYHLEESDQFPSIPSTFWWGVVTMTTTGYGDMVPETAAGQLVCALAAFVGVLTLGLNIPTLSNHFINYTHNFSYMWDKELYIFKLRNDSHFQKYALDINHMLRNHHHQFKMARLRSKTR